MYTPVNPDEIQRVVDAIEELHSMMDARLLLASAGILPADEVAHALEGAAVLLDSIHKVA